MSLLEITEVCKRFGGLQALTDVNLRIEAGHIHGLIGPNGAGKTTLISILAGLCRPTQGAAKVMGFDVQKDFRQARKLLGIVPQELVFDPFFTVRETLEFQSGYFGVRHNDDWIDEVLANLGLADKADKNMRSLSGGMKRRVLVAQALVHRPPVIVLDEPTAVLTPQEIDELLSVIKNLAASGVGVLFITHKLREVMAIADRVVVLRNGKLVGTTTPKETDEEGLAQMMVGRNVVLRVEKKPALVKETVLEIKNLSVKDDRNLMAVNDFSIEVHAGEILGIAGVEGNGQRELVEAVCGMRNRVTGSVKILGAESPNLNPHDVRLMGLSNIPEDREKDGLVSTYSIAENMVLNRYDQLPFANKGIRNFSERDKYAEALVKEFDVRTPSFHNLASSLSGGNKQKVVLARELSRPVRLLVAAQPTRGLDVGSILNAEGMVGENQGNLVILNPSYKIIN